MRSASMEERPSLLALLAVSATFTRKWAQVILLIFVSGRVVLTGGKSQEHINQAFALIYPSLKEFQKTVTTGPGARTG